MRRMYEDVVFLCGLGAGVVIALVLFFVFLGSGVDVSSWLCESVGQEFVGKDSFTRIIECSDSFFDLSVVDEKPVRRLNGSGLE